MDPIPGPRTRTDFTAVTPLSEHLVAITADSSPIRPAGSTLPRLASHLKPQLALLDPYSGATGLAEQLIEAAALAQATEIVLVDVGGDFFARGDEPTLMSPLPDALLVAACHRTALPTTCYLAGPGLDGELPESTLLPALPTDFLTPTPEHTRPLAPVFTWHPSEASALFAAAIQGARGRCEVRDTTRPIPLTPASARAYRLDLATVFTRNQLAQKLIDSTTLTEAEDAALSICGFNELARERSAAQTPTRPTPPATIVEALRAIDALFAAAHARGSDYLTHRALCEALNLPAPTAERFRRILLTTHPRHAAPPLWRTTPN